jgi:hypothetical protein
MKQIDTTCPECKKPVDDIAMCIQIERRTILFHIQCHTKASNRALQLALEAEEEKP